MNVKREERIAKVLGEILREADFGEADFFFSLLAEDGRPVFKAGTVDLSEVADELFRCARACRASRMIAYVGNFKVALLRLGSLTALIATMRERDLGLIASLLEAKLGAELGY